MKDDSDYLLLSQLTHAGYCLRRVALVMNEQVWAESSDTAKGRMEHDRVHDRRIERRREQIKLFEYEVYSDTLQLRGKCDCIEGSADVQGCQIPSVDFPVKLYPVEFKHGKVRAEEEYEIQLCAQAMCLEEMYSIHVAYGAFFYGEIRHRVEVEITPRLRDIVRDCAKEMHDIYQSRQIPIASKGKHCDKCSVKNICLPEIHDCGDVTAYLKNNLWV